MAQGMQELPGMKFETQPGISMGIFQRQGKKGMNNYGVLAGMGFKHEFYLRGDEVANFPPPETQCTVYGEVHEDKFGTKFIVHGYRETSGRAKREAA